ncbi:MAG: AAA family ATPase [Clostridia bacterium]|nr:AAA family ATPase [Clostridia bacterium]
MERVLEFEKYRNLGLKNRERIVLNKSLEKGKMGNLVIIVGANNSGKSNVLDGLLSFGEKKFNQKDVTTLSFDPVDRIPSLSLVTKDKDEIYSYEIKSNTTEVKICYPKEKNVDLIKSEWLEVCKRIEDFLIKQGYSSLSRQYDIKDKMIQIQDIKTIKDLLEVEKNIIQLINNIKNNFNNRYAISSSWTLLERDLNKYEIFKKSLGYKNLEMDNLNNIYNKKYGIEFMPKIYKYSEEMLSNANLQTTCTSFENNKFFNSLFNSINVSTEEIKAAYSDFKTTGDKGILTTFEKTLNKKLKQVAKKFNKLYILEEDTYSFSISLESTNIYFTMCRDEKNITLDYQSTGFKWFFNLYFNLLTSNNLKSGDIVIMDEPATNLHAEGQQELRGFLKEFAIKNDITIVIATHSPFLIDIDYLDELRVVTMENNVSSINNDFSTIDLEDPDSLKPIKKALTVRNHVLYDPDNKVIFVEGITDYNYMVAFKKKFDVKDVVFLPIKGVGKYNSPDFKEKQKEISRRLIEIKKHNPILMVDSDGAGNSMKNTNKDSELFVFSLSDVSPKFKQIEDLFSQQDKENFNLEKHSSTSSQFKTFEIDNLSLSEETINNFKEVFKSIDNL